MTALHPVRSGAFTCLYLGGYMHNCMRIYMAMVHMGAGCRRARRHGTKNTDARKKSRYVNVASPAAVPVRVYIKSAVCDNSNKKIKRMEKNTRERRKSIVSVAAARMTINLHRITMHVSIKNRSKAKRRYYVWVFRVSIRIIPRIRAMHARKYAGPA